MNTATLIPAQNVSKLQADFEKLQKKAAKLNCPVPSLIIGKRVMVSAGKNAYGEEFFTEKVEVSVTGEAPKLNGWSFIGTVEAVEGMTVLRSVPGHEIPTAYRDADPCNCDHCKINRRRNSTFIVQHDTGAYKQVGRSCLRDFLGHDSPEQVAAYAQYLVELDVSDYDEEPNYGPTFFGVSTDSVVTAAIRAIKMMGYGKTDSDNPTRDAVACHLFGKNKESRLPIEQADRDLAVQAIEWMQKQTGNEFMMNLAIYAKCHAVSYKAFGYLSAGTMMFLKSIDDLRATKVVQEINDEAVGTPGDKISVKAQVVTAHPFSRAKYHYHDTGMSQVLMLKTEDNKLIKVFTANMDIKQDDVVMVAGKIKDCSKETFEKSKFYGHNVTQMGTRTRLTLV